MIMLVCCVCNLYFIIEISDDFQNNIIRILHHIKQDNILVSTLRTSPYVTASLNL